MAKKEKKETKKQFLKTTKADISKKIEEALTDLKAGLGEKKFRKRLKKASAIFIDGITLSIKKEGKPQKSRKRKITEVTVAEDAAVATV